MVEVASYCGVASAGIRMLVRVDTKIVAAKYKEVLGENFMSSKTES